MRPFPQKETGKQKLKELWQEYRERMISFAGIAVFVFGNKNNRETGEFEQLAGGVRIEFDIAISQGVIPIPVGITGSMAAELWTEVNNKFGQFYSGFEEVKEAFLALNEPGKTLKECIALVLTIISAINKK
jgi:hypothetical protein